MTETEQNPAAIILRRREIRRSLLEWARECGYEPAAHHRLFIEKLEAVARGEIKRLMILVPPGSAKSTYASILFPVWYLAQRPGNSILTCSYSYTLAERFGKRCRNLIEQKEKVLGYRLSRHSQAAGDWATTMDSVYFAAGVGAGIAGHRADLGLIDDPIGSQEEADSEVIREKHWDWYWNDFYPRLKPNASQVIIANRRHEADLIGRLLEKEVERWTVIRIPMLAEANDPVGRQPGELLWPEWFNHEMIEGLKTQPRLWSGLYMQRPMPEEGSYFRKQDILTYKINELPNSLKMYAASDWAFQRGEDNDFTCHLLGGVDASGRLWIMPEWFWERVDTLTAVNKMFEMSRRHKPLCWWSSRENITGAIGPFVYQKMREENNYVPIEELPDTKSKESKAQPIKARMSAKMVMFPGFVPEWERAMNELLLFPGGAHDDFVDSLAKLGQGLSKMVPASRPQPTWDGYLREEPLTGAWLMRSDKRRQTRLASVSDS